MRRVVRTWSRPRRCYGDDRRHRLSPVASTFRCAPRALAPRSRQRARGGRRSTPRAHSLLSVSGFTGSLSPPCRDQCEEDVHHGPVVARDPAVEIPDPRREDGGQASEAPDAWLPALPRETCALAFCSISVIPHPSTLRADESERAISSPPVDPEPASVQGQDVA